MSKIDKLQIRGVRSFGGQNPMTIQFQTPLTLIVGMNGSGKTTIIECLKYVATGDVPPYTGKGALFVRDPELAGEKEVIAQVKISFTSTDKLKLVCTRNMSVTVKKNSRTFKQLEGSIRMLKDGERNTISSKVTELNGMMPRFFGVSKAVLENVIFCHQEDSYWPLGTGKDLKEKFDAIFEAEKYTRAIDTLKVLQKNQRSELVLFQKEEEHCKANNEKAKKLKLTMAKLEKQAEELRAKRKEYGREGQDAQEKAEEFWMKVAEANETVTKLQLARGTRETKEESVQSLRDSIVEMTDSDEELQRMLEEYEERIKIYRSDLESQREQWHELTSEIAQARTELSSKERELGSYEAQKKNNERQVEGRTRLIREAARSHNIRGFDLDIDDAQVKAFMERITKMTRDQKVELDQARSDSQDELQRQQKVLNTLNEQKSAKRQAKENSRQNMAAFDRKINDLQAQENDLAVDEGIKVVLESEFRDTQEQLQSAQTELLNASWEQDIETADRELRRLDELKEKLEAELFEATQRTGDSAQLDYVRKELENRRRMLETMITAHDEKLKNIFGSGWSPSGLEKAYDSAVNSSTAELSESEREVTSASQRLSYLDSKISELNKELKSAEAEMKDAEVSIRKALPYLQRVQDFPEEVSKLEQERDEIKLDTDAFDTVRKYLHACIEDGRKKNTCKTCLRSFGDKPDHLQRMIDTVQKQLDSYKINAADKNDLEQIERDLKGAKAATSSFDAWVRLKQLVIPEKQRQADQLGVERDGLLAEVDKLDGIVKDKERARNDISYHSRTVQTINKYQSEITTYEEQIRELTAKQESAGLSRGLEVIQSDKKKADDEAKAKASRKSDASNSRDRMRSRISTLELQLSNTKGKLSAAEYELKQKTSLQKQEEEYKSLHNAERQKIQEFESDIQTLDSELFTEKAKYDDIVRRSTDKDRDLQEKVAKLNSNLNKLTTAGDEIKSYEERGGDAQLDRCMGEIEAAQAEVSKKELIQGEIAREAKQLEERVRTHDDTKRSITDNQRFRRDLESLRTLRTTITELESCNAEADKETYNTEADKWQKRRSEKAAQEASATGQLQSIDDQISQCFRDWEVEYKDAAHKFKKSHIVVETTKAAIDDLGRYGGALDKAIMRYHTLKMDQINSTIADLWRKTYQGTDVDHILIRSESEVVKANKAYNYRVCMIKQDTEMDMRGRCSAGQKVLASIIIRLALAECFGVNCGIIALDEPTTNLDAENIRALALSLAEIIRERRKQSNFQIIIITHDEEFLRIMGGSEYTDTYFRVARNRHQESIIEKQNITDIM